VKNETPKIIPAPAWMLKWRLSQPRMTSEEAREQMRRNRKARENFPQASRSLTSSEIQSLIQEIQDADSVSEKLRKS